LDGALLLFDLFLLRVDLVLLKQEFARWLDPARRRVCPARHDCRRGPRGLHWPGGLDCRLGQRRAADYSAIAAALLLASVVREPVVADETATGLHDGSDLCRVDLTRQPARELDRLPRAGWEPIVAGQNEGVGFLDRGRINRPARSDFVE